MDFKLFCHFFFIILGEAGVKNVAASPLQFIVAVCAEMCKTDVLEFKRCQ